MIGFLCCNEITTKKSPWGPGRDTCLLRVDDRPILEHALELLADYGVTAVHVLLPQPNPERELYFGDGAPWKMKITCWQEGPEEMCMFAALGDDLKETAQGLIVAVGDCVPFFPIQKTIAESIWIVGEKGTRDHRWLLLKAEDARNFSRSGGVPPVTGIRHVVAPAWLDTGTPEWLLRSQKALSQGIFPVSPLFLHDAADTVRARA